MSRAGKAAHERRLSAGRKMKSRMSAALRKLAEGHIRIEDALRDPPGVLGRCSVYDVLRNAPGLGNEGAKKLCVRFELWPYDRLGDIPPEKRGLLSASLPERVKNR